MPENLPVISRPRTGALVGGVCAGLARRWQVDPNLLRIALVVLAFFGGLGLLAYGTGLLLMPRDGEVEPPVRRLLPFTRKWTSGAVVAVTITSAAVLAGIIGSRGLGIGPLLVIFFIWFFGFRGRGQAARRPVPPPEPTPFERAAENWRVRLVEQQTPGYADAALPVAGARRWEQPYTDGASDLAVRDDDLPVPVVAARRPRSWRPWWLALTLTGLAVFTVTVLGLVLGLPTTPLAYAAAVLGALGLSLLLSTRTGRPPLLLPAVLAAAVATGGLMVGTHLGIPSVGERTYVYSPGDDLPASLDLSAGELSVDLSKVVLSADRTIDLHVGTGQLNLVLPSQAASEVDWSVRTGEFNVADGGLVRPAQGIDTTESGFDLSGSRSYAGPAASSPTLRVRVSVDLGELDVRR